MSSRLTVNQIDQKYHSRQVVLVDDDDRELGTAGLVEAHRGVGLRHRAFSLQLYRQKGTQFELLLQRRSMKKPAFPGYWANTCCYNMVKGEEYYSSVVRRAAEELGVRIHPEVLKTLFTFSYYAPDLEGWCENELDTVIVAEWDGAYTPNPEEVMDVRWMEWGELNKDLVLHPDLYAPWFATIVGDARFRSLFE